MKEGRREWVDFERRLYTFLWEVLLPYSQIELDQFTG